MWSKSRTHPFQCVKDWYMWKKTDTYKAHVEDHVNLRTNALSRNPWTHWFLGIWIDSTKRIQMLWNFEGHILVEYRASWWYQPIWKKYQSNSNNPPRHPDEHEKTIFETTVPGIPTLYCNAILRVGFPIHKPYPYSLYLGEDSSICRYRKEMFGDTTWPEV